MPDENELLDWMIHHFTELKLEMGQLDLFDLEEHYGACIEFLERARTYV